MFVWVTLPDAVDARELLRRAIAEKNVAFVPGQAFFADGSGYNTMRLNFSLPTEQTIVEGIGRLYELMRGWR